MGPKHVLLAHIIAGADEDNAETTTESWQPKNSVFFGHRRAEHIYLYCIYIYIHPCRHPVTIQRSEIKAEMLVCAGMMLVMWWSLFVSLCLFCMVFGSLCWSRRVQLHHAPSVHQAMQGRGNWVHVAVGTVVFPLL